MKRYNFIFKCLHNGEEQRFPIQAESVREAKALAKSLCETLVYANDYEEVKCEQEEVKESDKFSEQKIAWICAKPSDELPFPFKQLKKAALLFAYGTDCQCCLGYRIMAGLVLGGVVGYLLG